MPPLTMSSTNSPSELPDPPLLDLPLLEQNFLAALRENDLDRLGQVNAHLSQLGQDLQQASVSKNAFPEDKAMVISIFSHNVGVASSLAAKVQLEMEEISNKFTQQLRLLPLPAPALPTASSSQTLPAVESRSSVPNVVLKKWSLSHLHNLFPSKEALEELASQTSMSSNQINLWFRNARTRSGWSKLFAHPRVNKDHERLNTLLEDYDSIKRHGSPEHFKSSLARDELLQLVDKVFHYFATSKDSKSSKTDAIRPWVKEVLSQALATLKDKTTGAIDSSRQKLTPTPSRKRARTNKNTPSPSPFSQSSIPIAGPSSTPSLVSESSASSLSQPTSASSFSRPKSTSVNDLPRLLSSIRQQSWSSDGPSPCSALTSSPVISSLSRSCTPVHSVFSHSPRFETPDAPPMSCPPFPITAPITSRPDHSTESGQFEDADES